MGCQCTKKSDEDFDEIKKESIDGINEEEKMILIIILIIKMTYLD